MTCLVCGSGTTCRPHRHGPVQKYTTPPAPQFQKMAVKGACAWSNSLVKRLRQCSQPSRGPSAAATAMHWCLYLCVWLYQGLCLCVHSCLFVRVGRDAVATAAAAAAGRRCWVCAVWCVADRSKWGCATLHCRGVGHGSVFCCPAMLCVRVCKGLADYSQRGAAKQRAGTKQVSARYLQRKHPWWYLLSRGVDPAVRQSNLATREGQRSNGVPGVSCWALFQRTLSLLLPPLGPCSRPPALVSLRVTCTGDTWCVWVSVKGAPLGANTLALGGRRQQRPTWLHYRVGRVPSGVFGGV